MKFGISIVDRILDTCMTTVREGKGGMRAVGASYDGRSGIHGCTLGLCPRSGYGRWRVGREGDECPVGRVSSSATLCKPDFLSWSTLGEGNNSLSAR